MVIALAAGAVLGPVWASLKFFRAPDGVPARLHLLYAAGVPFAAWLVHLELRQGPRADTAVAVAAGGFALAIALFWWAIHTHRRRPVSLAWSADPPLHLVDIGPYRWLRHPIYASYILSWTSAAAAAGDARAWVAPISMAALYACAARYEEAKYARSPFAERYARYKGRTGMFVPSRGALTRLSARGASSSRG